MDEAVLEIDTDEHAEHAEHHSTPLCDDPDASQDRRICEVNPSGVNVRVKSNARFRVGAQSHGSNRRTRKQRGRGRPRRDLRIGQSENSKAPNTCQTCKQIIDRIEYMEFLIIAGKHRHKPLPLRPRFNCPKCRNITERLRYVEHLFNEIQKR